MLSEILERPFGAEFIRKRPSAYGRELNYVEGRHYVERLNEAFKSEWSFAIVLHEVLTDEVVVLGKLTADGIEKHAFGGSTITKNKDTGEAVSIADDLKSAATDALKKAASLLGVGLHLYGDDQVEQVHVVDPAASNPDGNRGHGNGRLTSRQLSAIWGLSRSKGLAQRDVRQRCMETFGVQPEFMSKQQASEIIDRLKNAKGAA